MASRILWPAGKKQNKAQSNVIYSVTKANWSEESKRSRPVVKTTEKLAQFTRTAVLMESNGTQWNGIVSTSLLRQYCKRCYFLYV